MFPIRGSYSHFAPVSFTRLELSSLRCMLCGKWRNEALSLLNCAECDDVNTSLLYSDTSANEDNSFRNHNR